MLVIVNVTIAVKVILKGFSSPPCLSRRRGKRGGGVSAECEALNGNMSSALGEQYPRGLGGDSSEVSVPKRSEEPLHTPPTHHLARACGPTLRH